MGPGAAPDLRVAFVTGDPASASARVRVLDHVPGLARRGIEAELLALPRGLLARRRFFAGLVDHDLVVLHRRLLGGGDLGRLRRHARALLLDLDDAVWERPFRLGPARRERRRFARALDAVDAVSVGSAWLEAQVAPRHRAVYLLPPTCRWPDPLARPPRDDGEVRLAWTGSAATLPYLEDLGPVLAELCRRRPEVRLVVLADRPPRLPAGVPLRFHPWSLAAEAAVLAASDVGLYPLRDDPWSRGKCAYKVRLYMAFGLPTVAAPQGGGAEALEPPEAGRTAEGPAAWEAALEELIAAPDLRRAVGERARALARARHDLPRGTEALARVLREVAARAG